MKNVEVVIVNQGNEPTFEEELAKDVLEIITVFSARLYGSRSNKNKKIIENLKGVVDVVKGGRAVRLCQLRLLCKTTDGGSSLRRWKLRYS